MSISIVINNPGRERELNLAYRNSWAIYQVLQGAGVVKDGDVMTIVVTRQLGLRLRSAVHELVEPLREAERVNYRASKEGWEDEPAIPTESGKAMSQAILETANFFLQVAEGDVLRLEGNLLPEPCFCGYCALLLEREVADEDTKRVIDKVLLERYGEERRRICRTISRTADFFLRVKEGDILDLDF